MIIIYIKRLISNYSLLQVEKKHFLTIKANTEIYSHIYVKVNGNL